MITANFVMVFVGALVIAWILQPWLVPHTAVAVYLIIAGIALAYVVHALLTYCLRTYRCRLRTISAEALHAKIQTSSCTVINVLPAEYYHDCHIVGSRSIPTAELAAVTAEWPRDQIIVVYCAHAACDASRKAFQVLCSLGFTNVYAYEGGMREWRNKGLPAEGACTKDYLRLV